MALLMHGAEIAGLLALAYSLGWGIGFAARRAATPVAQKSPVPAARMAAVTGAAIKAPGRAPVMAPAFPATRPGLAWTGQRAGHLATPFVRVRQNEPDVDTAMRAAVAAAELAVTEVLARAGVSATTSR